MHIGRTAAGRTAVAAAVAVATVAISAGLPASVASAEIPVPLPTGTYGDLVLDTAHQRLFISGGPSSEVIAVTTDYGSKVGSITGEYGANGMALSADGSTLYVAESDGDAISAVSTKTLQEIAHYPTGTGTRPQDVVLAGGRLWFTYKGDIAAGQALTGGIGSVDLTAGGDTQPVTLEPPIAYGAPQIAVDPADPGTVVTAGTDTGNNTTLSVYDVSSGTPARTALSQAGAIPGEVRDMAVTPDGKDVAIATAWPKEIQLFALTDLTPDGSYSTGDDFAMAVAIAPDGTVATGSEGGTLTAGLRIFSPGAQTPRRTFSAPVSSGGLVWAPDESKLYAVSGGSSPTLRVYFDPEQVPTTITPDTPADNAPRVPGVPYATGGTMTSADAFPDPTVVHVKRSDAADPDGVALPDAALTADGAFTVTDPTPAAGDATYTFSYDGDKLHEPAQATQSVTFTPAATTASVHAPATAQRAALLQFPGALTSTVAFAGGQSVHVTRKDAAGTTALPDVPLAADGTFTVGDTPPVGGTVTYTAAYPGDISHDPATATATVQVSRAAASLTVTTNATNYSYNATATVTAHLGSTYNGRTVALYATPYGGTRTLVKSGAVDSHGNLTATYHVTRRTVFQATFAGDYRYAPATATRTVMSYARVTDTLKGYYTSTYVKTTLYRVFHHTVSPAEIATIAPNKYGQCVVFTTQKWYSSAWHTVATTGCVKANSSSIATWKYGGTHPTSGYYRFRAYYQHSSADQANLSTYGPWINFLFRT